MGPACPMRHPQHSFMHPATTPTSRPDTPHPNAHRHERGPNLATLGRHAAPTNCPRTLAPNDAARVSPNAGTEAIASVAVQPVLTPARSGVARERKSFCGISPNVPEQVSRNLAFGVSRNAGTGVRECDGLGRFRFSRRRTGVPACWHPPFNRGVASLARPLRCVSN